MRWRYISVLMSSKPNFQQRGGDLIPVEENMDLFSDSDMVNSLSKTSERETRGIMLLEDSYSVI